ncbi:6-phosphogluconate dehydrogenase C-terminal domain-like protein [Sporormia fimetaria CBS 119925]|uniref:6-phosphogluconate dehydrogenase C-terminal domain-like protein n=1 Tax=Sporormia fimetaria CBS 119925 TaxID=1340428 RepID=A0A6A6V3X1_9PLEO|nr:6-phosphogluconate dehydrogenase C-terminal domain-like protein [Sporormia fimetaria CBS 119925]
MLRSRDQTVHPLPSVEPVDGCAMSLEKVSIIGAGHCGCAHTIYLLRHQVADVLLAAHPSHSRSLTTIARRGYIESSGTYEGSFAPQTTTDITEAVRFSKTLFVILPSSGDELIVEELRKLNDELGQHIIIFISGNWIARRASQVLRARYIVETATAPYACRYPGGIGSISGIKRVLPVAALPSPMSADLREHIGRFFPQPLDWYDNCFKLGMASITGVIHPAPILLNADWIAQTNGELPLYTHCLTVPSVLEMVESLDRDRRRIAQAYGFSVFSTLELMNLYYGTNYHSLESFAMHSVAHSQITVGADGLQSRGVTQDVPNVLVPWYLFGLRAGIDSRPMRVLIDFASELNGEDYLTSGLTLDKLGLGHASKEQIVDVYTSCTPQSPPSKRTARRNTIDTIPPVPVLVRMPNNRKIATLLRWNGPPEESPKPAVLEEEGGV